MPGNRIAADDAFAYYVALAAERSYQAVADYYGVSKTAINNLAARDRWMPRLAAIEEAARQRTEAQLVETITEMRSRHLLTLRAIHGRAVAALKSHPIKSAMDAVRAIEIVIKLERLLTGEPSSRTVVSVPELLQREQDMLVVDVATSDKGESDECRES